MSNPRYTEEFKIEAVKQVADRGQSVTEVAARLGVSAHRLGSDRINLLLSATRQT